SPRRARFHRAKTATRARSDRIRKHLETANIKLGNVARSPSSSRVSAIARRAEEANAGLRSEGQDRAASGVAGGGADAAHARRTGLACAGPRNRGTREVEGDVEQDRHDARARLGSPAGRSSLFGLCKEGYMPTRDFTLRRISSSGGNTVRNSGRIGSAA